LAKGLCNRSPLAIQKIENRRDLSLRIMIYGVFLMVLAVGFVAVRTISEDDLLVSQLFFPIVSSVTLVSLSTVVVSLRMNTNVRDIIEKAANLEEYENDIRKKWGDDTI
jgi:hypothetical protein